ncbi:hypothetical protein MTX20_10035 [Bradyrhizobium sp. ISRA435]|nr:hypothetical protein MTX20_10035 [Bradyrhizobium sp. ISRA435]
MGAIGTRLSLRPLFEERAKIDENLGRNAPREHERTSCPLSCPAQAGHPVHRGLSAQAAASLEYRITRIRG